VRNIEGAIHIGGDKDVGLGQSEGDGNPPASGIEAKELGEGYEKGEAVRLLLFQGWPLTEQETGAAGGGPHGEGLGADR
jgi:hypothetical protein